VVRREQRDLAAEQRELALGEVEQIGKRRMGDNVLQDIQDCLDKPGCRALLRQLFSNELDDTKMVTAEAFSESALKLLRLGGKHSVHVTAFIKRETAKLHGIDPERVKIRYPFGHRLSQLCSLLSQL